MNKKKVISCFIGVVALGGAALFAGLTQAGPNDNKFHLEYTKKDVNAPLGTKDNVFTVVEIVPCESMAQIGYLIPGCEPIDMKALASCNDVDFPQDYENNLLLSNNGELADREKKSQRRFTDALTVNDIVDSWVPENELLLADGLKDVIDNADPVEKAKQYGVWKLKADGAYSEYGYYLRVEDGTGEFAMTEAPDGKKTFSPTADNDGDFAWFGNGYYSTEKDAGGNPVYVPFHDAEAEPEGRPIDYGETTVVGDKFWTNRADKYSYECWDQTITTTDAFIQQIFPGCSTEAGFQSQVLVVTPTQLNNMPEEEMKDLLGTAELIEFHTGTQGGMESTWIKFNKENKQLTQAELDRRTFAQNDINWNVTWTLVERMASERPAAMIMEGPNMYNVAGNNVLADSNVRKLYIMLMQYGAKAFYNQFGDKITVDTTSAGGTDAMTGEKLTTGWYSDPYKGHSATQGTNEVIWDDMTFYLNGVPEEESAALMHEKRLDASNIETFETIYSYNGDTSLFMDFMKKKPLSTTNNGATNSDAYEYFWNKDGEGSHADGLDGIDFMEYILHGFRGGQAEKSHLNILEVQPCNTFIYKDSPTWKLYYMKLLPWFNGTGADIEKDLTVTTMPTWEFIGSLEDLNAQYDLIIFGDNQNAGNGVAQANPDGTHIFNYNDNRYITYGWPEYALAYTGFGDLVQTGNQEMRYSGNDITERKLLELKSYLAGDQAIVVDGGLYNGTSSVNEKMVDKSSLFYKFAELGANTGLENGLGKKIFITTANRQNAMKKYVAYETCDLEFYTEDGSNGYPPEYSYSEREDGTIASNSVAYAQSGKLSYRFRINGLDTMNYGVGLYIDRSSDGVYGGSLVEQVVGNTFASEGMAIAITQNGNIVPNGSLKPGVWYMAECTLPSSYTGALPWKLEAYCSGNTNIRDSEIKCSTVRNRFTPKVEVKVLEMALTPNMSDADEWYRQYGQDVLYMATNGEHANEQLKKYLDCVDEYNVTVDFLENTEWLELFVNNPDYATREEKIEAWKNYLDDYDLLSIGYCDGLTFSQNDIYKAGFDYFNQLGKGILISHDMVQTADKDYSSAWLRGLAGQQRFTTNTGQIKGSITIPVPYESADNGLKLFCEYGDAAHSDRVMNDDAVAQVKAGNTDASYLNLVNAGQITNYPYKIDSLIEINPTHVQMNQLDMEKEGMSVWATMTDRYTKNYQSFLSTDMSTENYFGTGTGLYSSRESDVRNSYYLYNVGNITYTGVGHTGGELTTDEMKLYVNTLLAAYRPSPDKPYIEVTNEDKVESASETSFYIPFDGEEILNTSEEKEGYFRVHFTVVDTSILTNRTYTLNFCDAAGNALAQQWDLFTENGGKVTRDSIGWHVEKGGNYYYDVPYSLISKSKNTDYLNLKSEYVNPANVVVKTSEISAISEMKTPLFNLR